MAQKETVTYFGETDFRNKRTRFGVKPVDRQRHVYVIGKTGMGKSTLLENMAIQDIQNGEGMAFFDPHGSTAEKLLDYVPEHRIKDVIYFAPFDLDFPISFNVMEDVGADKRHLVVSGLMSSFKKIWVDAWSARMEYILNNVLLALLEFPGSSLLGVNRMLADKDYRKIVVENVKDPSVRAFWVNEYAKYNDRYMQEAGAAIQNKIGQFTSNPVIRNIIGQPKSSFDVRKVMDEKKILIVNLSKGRIGEQNANLLGGLLITKLYLGAMSRADAGPAEMAKLPNFYMYVDEFQSFANESFADILSEARKYKLNLTIAHQYVEQMSEVVRAAVFGNVGTTITFRVGPFDAEVLEKVFAPRFTAEDLVNLAQYQIYLTLMIDGVGSPPFSATALPPIPMPDISFRDQIMDHTRSSFGRPRAETETEIKAWHDFQFSEKPKFKERPASPREGEPTRGGPSGPSDSFPIQSPRPSEQGGGLRGSLDSFRPPLPSSPKMPSLGGPASPRATAPASGDTRSAGRDGQYPPHALSRPASSSPRPYQGADRPRPSLDSSRRDQPFSGERELRPSLDSSRPASPKTPNLGGPIPARPVSSVNQSQPTRVSVPQRPTVQPVKQSSPILKDLLRKLEGREEQPKQREEAPIKEAPRETISLKDLNQRSEQSKTPIHVSSKEQCWRLWC